MNSETRPITRQDRALLRSTLLRLTATQKLLCVAGVLAVAWLWYVVAGRILVWGLALNYEGLQAFGPQAIALLQQYSPFFWWALIIALTLIIAYFLYGIVQSSQRAIRLRIVDTNTVRGLAQQLSLHGIEVLQWAWSDRREPLRIGDLQRAYAELGAGRYGKIVQAREHAALLALPPDASATTAAQVKPAPNPAPQAQTQPPTNTTTVRPRQEPELRS